VLTLEAQLRQASAIIPATIIQPPRYPLGEGKNAAGGPIRMSVGSFECGFLMFIPFLRYVDFLGPKDYANTLRLLRPLAKQGLANAQWSARNQK
jgi:hypothetical protein